MKQISMGISAILCVLLWLAMAAPVAGAVETAYEFDPTLSLRGDCGTSPFDEVPDPSCPVEPPKGRFNEPRSVAIDAYGDEYVASFAFNLENAGKEGRIDIFDDEGHFISEFLDPYGPKSVAIDSEGNLYVFEQGEGSAAVARYSPTVYEPAAGNIEYSLSSRVILNTFDTNLGGLAVDFTNDHLYVSYAANVIDEFGAANEVAPGEPNPLLHTIALPDLPGAKRGTSWNTWVAVDGQRRRLYASYCKEEIFDCGVLALSADPPYTLLKEITGSDTPAGKFVSLKGWISTAVDESNGHFFAADLENSKNIYEFDQNFDYYATTSYSRFDGSNTNQIAVSNSPLNPNAANYRYLFVPLPRQAGYVFAFHPPIGGPPVVEAVEAANVTETEVELRATIDPDGLPTEYEIQYLTQAEYEAGGFSGAKTARTGTIQTADSVTEVLASVHGLIPGTRYRFRVIARNELDSDEKEGSFKTYADAPIGGGCANELLRTKYSALLPDCRAYELVTPADTNGRPPRGVVGFGGDFFATVEASPSGNAISFATEGGALPGTEGTGGFNGDLYRSARGSSGWGITRMGPTGTETNNPNPGSSSPDQEHAFWAASGEGTAVVEGITHYVRYPDGRAELVGRGSLGIDPSAVGQLITEGGTHIIFQTENVLLGGARQLEPDAAPDGTKAVYDRTADEVTHVVSLLPGDVPLKAHEDARFIDASADGSGIVFAVDDSFYLRLNNSVTYPIGEGIALADVSEEGRRVFYVQGGDLFAFDAESNDVIPFTEVGDATVVNIAPDGTRAYFVSPTAIAEAGANPRGDLPQTGEKNLYLSEEGSIRFVGTVTARDVEGESTSGGQVDGLGLWVERQAKEPARDPSRVTPSGSMMLFQSRANLTGYDSAGIPQLYRYDSASNRLDCISCPPTELPATGAATLETFAITQTTRPPFSAYGFVPNLRNDGSRIVFQSLEPLISTDTDQVQDVYEWEEQGIGSCVRPEGCVYLISSGHSVRDNYLYGVSRSGDDIFFVTEDVLVGADNDTASIYDARVGGGFPESTAEPCEGEGCRGPLSSAPSLTTPGTPAIGAEDNLKASNRHCRRGKRMIRRHGKVRCVKKHRRHHHRASSKGRAGR